MSAARRISIAIAALGGQGGGVLADWLVAAAESQGWWAQSTSVPGVAQRTGTTIYYVEVCDGATGVGRPVLALMPTPGDVDLVIAAEWMEAGRAILRGLVTPERTTLVASTHRIYSIEEKSAPGDGIVDAAAVLAAARAEALRVVMFDMERLANEQGTVISAVMLGAAAACGALPFPQSAYEQAIRDSGVAVDASLRGFAAGAQCARSGSAASLAAPAADAAPADAGGPAAPGPGAARDAARRLRERLEREVPAGIRSLAREGVRRLVDYQDHAYAALYLDRLASIVALEESVPARGATGLASEAVARYLALWMSYEDTIRVADLKTRAARFERVRAAAGARPGEIVQIEEFMHPRVEEICDTLPAGLGRRLLASPAARRALARLTRRGRRVRTSGLRGFLMLYAIAALRRFRRRTLRFQVEQERIEAWLGAIARVLPSDPQLAAELAECQRLVKGYGDTHARGLSRFDAILAAAAAAAPAADLAGSIRGLRAAALADEEGRAFEAALAAHNGAGRDGA